MWCPAHVDPRAVDPWADPMCGSLDWIVKGHRLTNKPTRSLTSFHFPGKVHETKSRNIKQLLWWWSHYVSDDLYCKIRKHTMDVYIYTYIYGPWLCLQWVDPILAEDMFIVSSISRLSKSLHELSLPASSFRHRRPPMWRCWKPSRCRRSSTRMQNPLLSWY